MKTFILICLLLPACVSNSMLKEQKLINEKLDAIARQTGSDHNIISNNQQFILNTTEQTCKPRMF